MSEQESTLNKVDLGERKEHEPYEQARLLFSTAIPYGLGMSTFRVGHQSPIGDEIPYSDLTPKSQSIKYKINTIDWVGVAYRMYRENGEEIIKMRQRIKAFQSRARNLDSETFIAEWITLQFDAEALREQLLKKYVPEIEELRAAMFEQPVFESVDIRSIDSFKRFLKSAPLEWMPRKEDVARILEIAKIAHAKRIEQGHAKQGDPISILDVGGGTGALSALLASTSNEKIAITVLEPYQPLNTSAQEMYGDIGGLHITNDPIETYCLSLNTNEQLKKQIEEYTRLRHLLKRKVRGVLKMAEEAKSLLKTNPTNSTDDRGSLSHYLEAHYDTQIPRDIIDDEKKFRDYLEQISHSPQIFADEAERILIQKQSAIEAAIAQQPTNVDLVINSWMPPGVNLSDHIRWLNPASVIYMLDTYGSTGIRDEKKETFFASQIVKIPGQMRSYSPGTTFHFVGAWFGPSVAELQRNIDPKSLSYFDQPGGAFSNTIAVQIKNGFEIPIDSLKTHTAVVNINPYPWEDELSKRYGPIAPMIELPTISMNPREPTFFERQIHQAVLQIICERAGKDKMTIDEWEQRNM